MIATLRKCFVSAGSYAASAVLLGAVLALAYALTPGLFIGYHDQAYALACLLFKGGLCVLAYAVLGGAILFVLPRHPLVATAISIVMAAVSLFLIVHRIAEAEEATECVSRTTAARELNAEGFRQWWTLTGEKKGLDWEFWKHGPNRVAVVMIDASEGGTGCAHIVARGRGISTEIRR